MNEWELKKFKIDKSYGDDHYSGEISFKNEEYESFSLKLTKRQTSDILRLIQPDIAFRARELCDQLIDELEDQILNK